MLPVDETMRALYTALMQAGYKAVGPRKVGEEILYGVLDNPDDLLLGTVIPSNTLKEFFFPKHEVLFTYQPVKNDVTLADAPREFPKTAFLAVRPCDAAGLAALDKLFGWDYDDNFYLERRKNSLIVSLACDEPLAECFCHQAGRHPASTEGADEPMKSIVGNV